MNEQNKIYLLKILKNKKIVIGAIIISIYIFIAIFAPLLTGYTAYEIHSNNILATVSKINLFGTDSMGRDVFARVLFGSRISLFVAISVGIISALIGLLVGIPTGYFGGKLDLFVMRVIDVIMAFPWVLIALLFAAIFAPSIKTVIIALGIVWSPSTIRVVRGKVLSVKEEKYIPAAKASGENSFAIMIKYILPNIRGPFIVQTTLTMAWAILGEAGISYLGFGTQPPEPSWGLILADAANNVYSSPITLSILPGVCLFTLILGINYIGDGLRDLLDPKFRNL